MEVCICTVGDWTRGKFIMDQQKPPNFMNLNFVFEETKVVILTKGSSGGSENPHAIKEKLVDSPPWATGITSPYLSCGRS